MTKLHINTTNRITLGDNVAVLDLSGDKATFTGNADEAAQIFFDSVVDIFNRRIEQIRIDEREHCSDLIANMISGIEGVRYAEAIRARGSK